MRFAIIDLANLFHRCLHVTQGDAYTKAGMALSIIFRSLKKLHRDMKVDHMVFCTEGGSWRYDVYPRYKERRKLERMGRSEREKEDDEVSMSVLQDLIAFIAEKTRCTLLHSPGIEGDDFVARWIQLHPHDEHIILSGDSDFIQLLAPNVSIVDGVQERVIRADGVTNYLGEALLFSVDPSKGKLKIAGTVAEAKKKHDKEQREREKAHIAAEKERAKAHDLIEAERAASEPDYKRTRYVAKPYKGEEFSFTPEPEWWRKALFVKIVRGDAGDNIFSAYPGVRYEGSTTKNGKTGIREAWEDRHNGGYNWNNFMLQRWQKLVGKTEDGEPVKKEVQVRDEFAFNEMLIDLTRQPDAIKERMDEVIVQAVQKEPVSNVGIHFMRFCGQQDLPSISKEAHDHTAYLGAPYAK